MHWSGHAYRIRFVASDVNFFVASDWWTPSGGSGSKKGRDPKGPQAQGPEGAGDFLDWMSMAGGT